MGTERQAYSALLILLLCQQQTKSGLCAKYVSPTSLSWSRKALHLSHFPISLCLGKWFIFQILIEASKFYSLVLIFNISNEIVP